MQFLRDYAEAVEDARERNEAMKKELAKSRQKFARPARRRR